MKDATYIRFSTVAAILFLVILCSMHFIKSDLNPSWNFISEYEVGNWGWLMRLAFISLGAGCGLLAIGLWNKLSVIGKIGIGMLLISAIGLLMGGIFKTDPLNTPVNLQTQAGKLHQTAAMLDMIPFAALLITVALFQKKSWKGNKPMLVFMLVLVWFGFIYFVASVKSQFPADGIFGPAVAVGWQNRLMIVTQALWVIYMAKYPYSSLAE
jgi:hypothetical protein